LLTVSDVLQRTTAYFKDRQLDTPRLDAEVLLAWVLKTDRLHLYMEPGRPLTVTETDDYRDAVKRRGQAEPVAYITGEREFLGRPFYVSHDVLIPRPETEHLVEVATDYLNEQYPAIRAQSRPKTSDQVPTALDPGGGDDREIEMEALTQNEPEQEENALPALRFVDLCTGSGIVGISLAKYSPALSGVVTDVSKEALEIASRNANRHGVEASVELAEGSLYSALDKSQKSDSEKFHLIVSNPPYIATNELAGLMADVKNHEPHLALDGGPDGLSLIRDIISGAPNWLHPNGFLALEIGYDQGEIVSKLLQDAGFGDVTITPDLAGHDRVASGIWPE
jgi:release factor glutamine methyltransferase